MNEVIFLAEKLLVTSFMNSVSAASMLLSLQLAQDGRTRTEVGKAVDGPDTDKLSRRGQIIC
ncbi:MAG: hypothetical protein R3E64_06055 [Halioglobus sp.]